VSREDAILEIILSNDSASNSESTSGVGPDTYPAGTQPTERDSEQRALRRFAEAERRREQGLDKTLADTFPCSDPLSSIPNPGIQSW